MGNFDSFSPLAVEFLKDLKANNTKDWFAANKATYEETIKGPGSRFAADMAMELKNLTGQSHNSKIFRIHRDVRFSKDKTPYNAHLHIAFMPETSRVQPPMWFFGLSPGKLSLGCGVFQYDKDALALFRAAMSGPMGTDLMNLSSQMRDKGFDIKEPDLKRVPSGFDKDHPNSDALRRKGFSVWNDNHDPKFVTKPDLVKRTADEFVELLPVYHLLSQIA